MSTGKLAVAGFFILAFFGIIWWYLPGLAQLINTGTPKEIIIEALFPVIAAFFCLYMAVRIALSKESGPYRDDE